MNRITNSSFSHKYNCYGHSLCNTTDGPATVAPDSYQGPSVPRLNPGFPSPLRFQFHPSLFHRLKPRAAYYVYIHTPAILAQSQRPSG